MLDMDDITDFNRILLLLKLEATFNGYKQSGGAVVEKEKKVLCLIASRIPVAKGDHYYTLILKTKNPKNLADVAYDERCVGCVLQFFRLRSCTESHH